MPWANLVAAPMVNANAARSLGIRLQLLRCWRDRWSTDGSSDREGGYPASDPVDAGQRPCSTWRGSIRMHFPRSTGPRIACDFRRTVVQMAGDEPVTCAYPFHGRCRLRPHVDHGHIRVSGHVADVLPLEAPASPKLASEPPARESPGLRLRRLLSDATVSAQHACGGCVDEWGGVNHLRKIPLCRGSADL